MSSELREVFEMVTKQTEPESDAWGELERRQCRRSRNRKLGALAIATPIGIVAVVVSLVSLSRTAEPPADEPTPRPTPARLGSLAYAVRGDILVAEWDGSNAVRIADGRPPSDCGTGAISGTGEYFVAAGPIWSPDGRYLAYRHADCDRDAWWDVVISDAEGNVVTSFPSEGWGISWSPDSTRVAVWDHWGGEPWTIGVYGLKGERQTLLTLPFVIPAGESDPVWSPDGRSLLLGNFEIPLDGSTPRPLPWTYRDVVGWALSPDGSRVAYTSSKSLVVAAADGSSGVEVLADGATRPPNLLWSPTGDRIAFTSQRSRELRLVDVATGTVSLLIEPDGPAVLSVMAGGGFEFSPDGDRILFSRTEEDGTGANSLWSVNVDGSNLRRLVAGTAWGDWLSHSQTG
jgi:dipeptidyl aminopeptidase/acylaminoacyl peptidase